MAGAGYKLFNTGDVLTAAQVNTYLMEQTIMVFANATARDTALSGVLAQGMQCFLKDTNTMQYYSGSAWVTLSTGGDITSVTAGTGLSGGGTSGDVTLSLSVPVTEVRGGTNQTTYTTGDLLYASGTNTLAKRAIGTTGQVLTVSGGVPTWATASSGAYTSLATGTLSSSQVDITSISTSYRDLVLIIRNYKPTNDNSTIYWAFNADRNNRYTWNQSVLTDTALTFGNNYALGGRGNDNSVATGLTILTIKDYANTSTWKIAFTESIEVNATTTTSFNFTRNMIFYNQTAAITQINILDSGGSFTSGDYVLYGVK